MGETAELTFEQAFQQLEDVVQKLETGDLLLEESLTLFERGMLLAKVCESKLDEAEQKVSQVVGADGKRPLFEPPAAGED
jgi:exodeoxyribonuclease VII small subunit